MDATAKLLLDLGNLAGKHGYPQIVFHYRGEDGGLFEPGWYAYAVHVDALNTNGIHTKIPSMTPSDALILLYGMVLEAWGY